MRSLLAAVLALFVWLPVAGAYTFLGPVWPSGKVLFYVGMGSSSSALIDGSTSWNTPVISAMALWNQSGGNVSITYLTTSSAGDGNGKNEIFFSASVYGKSFGSALAVTTNWSLSGKRTEADIIFDLNEKWNSYRGSLRTASGGSTLNDVRRVALHEIGHALGLGHPDQAGQSRVSIMNSKISNTETLQTDDLNGIRTLYPPPSYTLTTSASGGTITRSPNQTSYVVGTQVTLTATASPGYVFTGWSGGASGTATSVKITINGNTTVTANFAPVYAITVTATNGTVSRSPSQSTYAAGTSVVLTATPAAGYIFTGWSGSVSLTANPITITMNANKAITANFSPAYSLTVSATNGTVTKAPSQTSYLAGTSVKLTATAASGYIFTGWSGGLTGTANPATITMSGNKSVTATFARAYNIYLIPDTTGQILWSATGPYAVGTVVTLTAKPAAGYVFSKWYLDGGGTSTANPISITMTSDKSMSVSFSKTYSLSVAATHGTVTRSPDLAAYVSGTNVTLTATPATGYVFTGWTGSATGTTNPLTLNMVGNKALTANFIAFYTLGVSATNGTVTKTPNQSTYLDGTKVTLQATPAANYAFTGWSGTVTSSANPLELALKANHSITANFKRTYTLDVQKSVGSVLQSPPGGVIVDGTKVTLRAVAPAGYRFTGWTGSYAGTLNPLVLTVSSNQALTAHFVEESDPRVVAVFEKDVLATPSPGWSYLLNTRGEIGQMANYQALLATTSPWARFDGNGVAGLPDAAPFGSAYVGKVNNLSTFGEFADRAGGHPGLGTAASAAERYAIASYTFGEAGRYSIARSALANAEESPDGLNLRIYLDDRFIRAVSTSAGLGAKAAFDTDLGAVAAGTRLFIAVGPGSTDTADTFSLAYSVVRNPEPTVNAGTVTPARAALKTKRATVVLSGRISGNVAFVKLTGARPKRTALIAVSGGAWSTKWKGLRRGNSVVTVQGIFPDGSVTPPSKIRIRRQ